MYTLVVLKNGQNCCLGGDFEEHWGEQRGDRGENNTKGAKTLNHYYIEFPSVDDHWVNFGCDLNALIVKKLLVDSYTRWNTTVPHKNISKLCEGRQAHPSY